MFSARFNPKDLKVQLKLAINRIKMLMRKKENQGLLAKKEVAELLGKDKVELARIKTELIIKDDYLIETLEILEVYFNVILSRMGLIERQKEVHPEIMEAIMTILWAGPRLEADVAELPKICAQLTARFGKPVAEDAMANTQGLASDRVVKKMTVVTPPRALVEAYLAAIAKTYNVMYNYIEPVDPSMMDPSMQSTVTPDMFPDVPAPGGGPWMPPSNWPGAGGGGGGGGGGGVPALPYPGAPGLPMPPPPGSYQPEQPSQPVVYPPTHPHPGQQQPGNIFPPALGPEPTAFPAPGGPMQPVPMQPTQPQPMQPLHSGPPPQQHEKQGWDAAPAPAPGAAAPSQPSQPVEKRSQPTPTAPSPAAPAYSEEPAYIDPFPMPPSDGTSPDALTPSGFPTAPGQGSTEPPATDAPVPEFDDLLSRFKQLRDE
eukprot:m.431232 g.431232  ORF g.431232 m.431232 type:complete len:429 (-) comp17274_c0_seq1:4279-5565(-)